MQKFLIVLGFVVQGGLTCETCFGEPVATMTVRSKTDGPISKVALIDSFNAGFKAATRIMEQKILGAFKDVQGMEALKVSVSPVKSHGLARRPKHPRRGSIARRQAIAQLFKKLRTQVLAMRIPSSVSWDSSSRNPFSLSSQAQQLGLPTKVLWGPVPPTETLPFVHAGVPLVQEEIQRPGMIVFENNNFENEFPQINSDFAKNGKGDISVSTSEVQPTVLSLSNFLKKNFRGGSSNKGFRRTHASTLRASPLPGAF